MNQEIAKETAAEEAPKPERSPLLANIKSLSDLDLENKRVFIRVDFNCPLEDGKVSDDSRIREALPTIKHAMAAGAKVILASHLGRPKGKPTPEFSLEPCAAKLAELLDIEVHLPEDCIGDAAKKVIFDLRGGQVCLLENLRFHAEEEANDEQFAAQLAQLADCYVNDAFGAAHRAHASVHALARMFPQRAAGLLVEKELSSLGRVIANQARPFVAILGGAKVSDKIEVIEALLGKVDALLIGGAMANTFLAAQGLDMKRSRVEADKLPLARTLMEKAKARGVDLLLPVDVVAAPTLEAKSGTVVATNALPDDGMALDIGPATTKNFASRIADAKTIFWNGPMGLFEKAPFAAGSVGVAKAMAASEGFTVIGGGDSAAAVKVAGGDIASKIDHISTGGGASLELIEGKKLPGIEVLRSLQ